MKKTIGKAFSFIMVCILVLGMTACGKTESNKSVNTQEVANDYYLDLTELGMKLTVYLRLDGEGNFIFSNTLDFETDKSSGTFQKSGEEYIMVFTSVNGEEVSVSDGLTSSFILLEDGSLDFTSCETVSYGSANITTTSEDNPDAKLVGYVVTEDYAEPKTDSAFQIGTYVTEDLMEAGVTYSHVVSFFEDNSYVHMIRYEKDGQLRVECETGNYGISTSQLALEIVEGERIECEVVDNSNLNLSLLPYVGATERVTMSFTITDNVEKVGRFGGTGAVTGNDETFEVSIVLYEDGSYEAIAEGFTETGILTINSDEEYVKQYPDHPETGVRGLTQVATVPYGTCTYDGNGNIIFTGLRIRNSESLTRYECTVTQQ